MKKKSLLLSICTALLVTLFSITGYAESNGRTNIAKFYSNGGTMNRASFVSWNGYWGTDGGNVIENAFDGNLNTYSNCSGAWSGSGIEIEFDHSRLIDTVDLAFLDAKCFPRAYQIYTSHNGSEWHMIVDVSGITEPGEYSHTFEPASAKYLRIIHNEDESVLNAEQRQMYVHDLKIYEFAGVGVGSQIRRDGWTASSYRTSEAVPQGPEQMIDDHIATYWVSPIGGLEEQDEPGSERWISVNMNKKESVDMVVINCQLAQYVRDTDKMQLYVSDDGISWTEVQDVTFSEGKNGVIVAELKNSITAQYIKVTAVTPSDSKEWCVSDFAAYSKANTVSNNEKNIAQNAVKVYIMNPAATEVLPPSYNTYYGAFAAIDGNRLTGAWGANSWLTSIYLEFDKVYQIDRVNLEFLSNKSFPKAYKLEASYNNVQWVTLADVKNNEGPGKFEHTFTPVNMKYLRLIHTEDESVVSGEVRQMQVHEIEIFEHVVDGYEINKESWSANAYAVSQVHNLAVNRIIDGDAYNFWISDTNNDNYGDMRWVSVDMGKTEKVDTMMINCLLPEYTPDVVTLYSSDDGSTWKEIKDVTMTGGANGIIKAEFDNAVSTRYFKIESPYNENMWLVADWVVAEVSCYTSEYSAVKYYKGDNEITTLVSGDIRVVNTMLSNESRTADMYLGLYEDGKLIKVVKGENDFEIGRTISSCEATITVPAMNNGKKYELCTFVWDGMEPVCAKNILTGATPAEFDTETLYATVPTVTGLDVETTDTIQAIKYSGAEYKGEETEVFAYIGYPDGASADAKVPAVILIHGGGGTAYSYWVNMWNERGYAAIAMDMNGKVPKNIGLAVPTGYPDAAGFSTLTSESVENQWMYQCIENIILANNILRNDEKIDANKIGITGASWGGIITAIASGVDDRLAWAAPVYGAGYMDESYARMSDIFTPAVAKIWEPKNYIGSTDTPVLWVNSDTDPHFSVDITSKSYLATADKSVMSVIPSLGHDHYLADETYPGIANFADKIVKGEAAFAEITNITKAADGSLTISYTENADCPIVSATLQSCKDTTPVYTTGAEKWCQNTWTSTALDVSNSGTVTAVPAENVHMYYVNLTDANGNVTSTPLMYK